MRIAVERLPATQRLRPEPLVLLHGWGSDTRSWEPLLPALNYHYDLLLVSLPGFHGKNGGSEVCESMDSWLAELQRQLPERYLLVGWSLGGMLALQLAAREPKRVLGLITLASNLCFVARDDWPQAMPEDTFAGFYDSFGAAAAATLKRFAGLMAKGAGEQERELLKTLRQLSASSAEGREMTAWQQGLQWLQQLDNRAAFAQLTQPGLHLLAADDALVPAQVEEDMAQLNLLQRVDVVSDSCHALHWQRTDEVAARVTEFVEQIHYTVDKASVAQSFGRAAHSYDSVAGLQRDIGHNLLRQIDTSAQVADRWLDLGCGTGYFEPHLCRQLDLPGQNLIALDLSHGMLQFAREERGGDYLWLCGDAESLPLADNSVDGIFSTLAIQWCSDLPALFAELQRVLKPGGRAYLATLGPGTLRELRAAWSQVDQFTHVNRFASEQQVRAGVESSGLQLLQWQGEEMVLRYSEVRQLTHELKALGAHNMNHGRASGLTGRQRLQAFKLAYENFRQADGLLPATYDVFYLQLLKH
ncbi:malonyl-ACP O-methyltransferase BioC [Pseudomaricurvus sp. HS19]|nr:malonyl-ACP O-methyltransferase BioC [Pseudomaricurvus sp. HS19]